MTDPVSTFIDGLEEQLTAGERILGPVHRPGSSEVINVPEPPEEMNDPVYSPEAGWMDRAELSYEPMVWVDPSEVE